MFFVFVFRFFSVCFCFCFLFISFWKFFSFGYLLQVILLNLEDVTCTLIKTGNSYLRTWSLQLIITIITIKITIILFESKSKTLPQNTYAELIPEKNCSCTTWVLSTMNQVLSTKNQVLSAKYLVLSTK